MAVSTDNSGKHYDLMSLHHDKNTHHDKLAFASLQHPWKQ
jgi:hypothetical protein